MLVKIINCRSSNKIEEKVHHQPTVNKNLQMMNQAQRNKRRTKVRKSKTPATITILKNILEIKNDDKERNKIQVKLVK